MTNQPAASLGKFPFCFSRRQLAILLLAWISLFAGINTKPIEDHESLVLQTTREMSARGDWVLPYFNQKPRLNKPPLNYWFTKAISVADPFSDDIEPWHGRACSLLGGLMLLLTTAYACGKLYGAPTGFLATILLLGIKGFVEFSHQARPDFLYSALCVVQLFAWIGAWRASDGSSSQRLYSSLGWGLAGLATLSKGPQVSALFLLGFLLLLLCGSERRRTLKVLRPVSGAMIFLAISLPWWLLLQNRLQSTGINIANTQLSGALLATHSVWEEILSFYYIFTLLEDLLPLSVLLPFLIFWNRRKLGKPDDVSRLLLYVSSTTLLVFTVAGHYRPHYMLPLLPLFTTLLAIWIRKMNHPAIPKFFWRVFFSLGVVALLVCAGLLFRQHQYQILILLSVTSVALVLLLKKEACEKVWGEKPLLLPLIATSLLATLLFTGFNALPSRKASREQNRDLGFSIQQVVKPGDQVATWKQTLDVMPYYTRHQVLRVDESEELKIRIERLEMGNAFYLLIPQNDIPDLESEFEISMLETTDKPSKSNKELVCVKILKPR
ncbi:MAG: hypothetical protein H8M99_13705 [Gloeobacteraceae cyanobacterium ES-bin-144]|nr:hypothetical protein [Verrucomicrobiales bacterium]